MFSVNDQMSIFVSFFLLLQPFVGCNGSFYPFVAFSCLEKVLRKLEKKWENIGKFRRELGMAISRKTENDRLGDENRIKKERPKLR